MVNTQGRLVSVEYGLRYLAHQRARREDDCVVATGVRGDHHAVAIAGAAPGAAAPHLFARAD